MPPQGPRSIQVDDELIVSGPIAHHGIAVLTAREGFELDPPPSSDCAPLVEAVMALLRTEVPLRALRDATRGGLAAVLHEWASESGTTLAISERLLPVSEQVRGVCELLGLDPIHVANEGTMVVAVPSGESERTIEVLRGVPETEHATYIGKVEKCGLAPVVVERLAGRWLPLDEPVGAPLPRIC